MTNDDNKLQQVAVYLTPAQKTFLLEKAEMAGVESLNGFLRDILKEKFPDFPDNLYGWGGNRRGKK